MMKQTAKHEVLHFMLWGSQATSKSSPNASLQHLVRWQHVFRLPYLYAALMHVVGDLGH